MTVLSTPYARLLGVPNAVVGLGFYTMTGAWAVLSIRGQAVDALWWPAFGIAAAGVVAAPYLIWALVSQLRVWCGL